MLKVLHKITTCKGEAASNALRYVQCHGPKGPETTAVGRVTKGLTCEKKNSRPESLRFIVQKAVATWTCVAISSARESTPECEVASLALLVYLEM